MKILIFIVGLLIGFVYGAVLGAKWCANQIQKAQEESITRIVIDIEELKKQMKEEE